jgi:phospholipid/cholesterol/gamma-HCH transport system substrate-binding protein
MSKKANPATIGVFICVALILGVGAILLFSSARWFSKTQKCILYFDGSVLGLNPGAPVKFRGVTVGSVREVLIRHNQHERDRAMPVIVELDQSVLNEKSDFIINIADKQIVKSMIDLGLRGTIEAQSIVTGLLYVELEIRPFPAPAVFHQVREEYLEIPTQQTKIQLLIENIADIDFKQLMTQMSSLAGNLQTNLGALNLKDVNDGLTNLLVKLNQLVSSEDLTNALKALHTTLDKFSARIDPLADQANGLLVDARKAIGDARHAIADARDSLTRLNDTLQNAQNVLAPQASLRRDLTATMQNISEAARSITMLADFLNRNPNALISGRKYSEPKPNK